MVIAVVQTNPALGTAVTSLNNTFGSTPAAGNAVIVMVAVSGLLAVPPTITDNQSGNTYVLDRGSSPSALGAAVYIFHATNINSSGTFTVTASGLSSQNCVYVIVEVSGQAKTGDITDVSSLNENGTSTTVDTGATTTTDRYTELAVACCGDTGQVANTVTTNGGWTPITTGTGVALLTYGFAYNLYGANSLVEETWTVTTAVRWDAVVVVYRPPLILPPGEGPAIGMHMSQMQPVGY